MRSTLLITLTLLLTACSDNAPSEQTASKTPAQESVTVEKEAAVATKTVEQNRSKEQTQVADAKEAVTGVAPAPKPAAPVQAEKKEAAVNGRTVFSRQCASCHGQNAEKAALNKSQVIAGWAPQKTTDALKGYQDGSYGGNMKAIMKGQAGGLSDAEIQAVADYISTL